jgi:hypothetical protein
MLELKAQAVPVGVQRQLDALPKPCVPVDVPGWRLVTVVIAVLAVHTPYTGRTWRFALLKMEKTKKSHGVPVHTARPMGDVCLLDSFLPNIVQ